MRINNNMMAMNTHRQLGLSNTGGAKSMEKLSSGYRINRAGDDAAGLSISEKMRGQIRGLNQASRNAQDGISLIQTAEGALNETHAILQRMRELAVQSATDTNTEADRGEIQKEINQLTSEINRIGNTTEFNTMKLVDGSRGNTYISGVDRQTKIVNGSGGTVDPKNALGVTDGDTWESVIKGGITVGTDSASGDKIDWDAINMTSGNTISLTKTASGDLTVDIVATDAAGDKFTYTKTYTKDQLAAASGTFKVDFHGVSFDLDVAEFNKTEAGADTLVLDLSVAAGDPTNVSAGAKDTYGLVSNFSSGNAVFSDFTIDGTNEAIAGLADIEISLSDDGSTFTIKGYDESGKEILSDAKVFGTDLVSGNTFTYEENGIKFTFEVKGAAGDVGFATKKLDVRDKAAKIEVTETPTQTLDKSKPDNSLAFQVGANENQSMSLEIGDMRSDALRISSKTGGSGFASNMAITDGTDNEEVEYSLNVTSREDAQKAITTIQSAIDTVSSQRSALGAVQNRLEHTIKNLDTSSENLQASESRIRDVDMAAEMMEHTRQNILQQAATAMLAQANQAPQNVLQLLR